MFDWRHRKVVELKRRQDVLWLERVRCRAAVDAAVDGGGDGVREWKAYRRADRAWGRCFWLGEVLCGLWVLSFMLLMGVSACVGVWLLVLGLCGG